MGLVDFKEQMHWAIVIFHVCVKSIFPWIPNKSYSKLMYLEFIFLMFPVGVLVQKKSSFTEFLMWLLFFSWFKVIHLLDILNI